MINTKKFKRIERELKEKLTPQPLKYMKVKNNFILIEPDSNGLATIFELVIGMEITKPELIFNSLEEIKNKFPNKEIINDTENIEKLNKDLSKVFDNI